MLKKLWTALFAQPLLAPWDEPRVVWGHELEYPALRSRLDVVEVSAEFLQQIKAFNVMRDRHTGQLWDTIFLDESSARQHGLRPHGTH